MMEDFNRMCEDMEAGLNKNAAAAAEAKARGDKGVTDASGARTAAQKAQTSADAAQASADAAQSAADAAQNTADTALAKANAAFAVDNRPYVWGKYTGTAEDLDVTLGFQPYFLIIWVSGSDDTSIGVTYLVITQGASANRMVTATDTGFRLNKNPGNTGINSRGAINFYIAFR